MIFNVLNSDIITFTKNYFTALVFVDFFENNRTGVMRFIEMYYFLPRNFGVNTKIPHNIYKFVLSSLLTESQVPVCNRSPIWVKL